MQGDLHDSGLVDVLRGLGDGSVTGRLSLDAVAGEAEIVFRGGAVCWAMSPAPRAQLGARLVGAGFITREQLETALEAQSKSDGQKRLGALLVDQGLVTDDVIRVFVQEQILDALFDVASWSEGSYAFDDDEVEAGQLPVAIQAEQVIGEVARRQQEWARVTEAIPSLDLVPYFVTGGSAASTALEPDEFSVMASVDGDRSVRELASDLGYSEFEVGRIVYGLVLQGIVAIADGPGAAPDIVYDRDTELLEVELDASDLSSDVDVGAALEEALAGVDDAAITVEQLPTTADEEDEPAVWVGSYDTAPADASAPPSDEVSSLIDDIAGAQSQRAPDADSDSGPDDAPDLEVRNPGATEPVAGEAETPEPEVPSEPAPAASGKAPSRNPSELLRELSQLAAFDDPGTEDDAGTDRPPKKPTAPDDPPKKRRLFGR